MKIIAEYRGEEILLKNYNSYLELDRTLSLFESKDDLITNIGLDKEIDNIYVLDNNGKIIDYDPKTIRTTLNFYEQNKGDEFVEWIYNGISDSKLGWPNKGILAHYFCDRQLDFTKNMSEEEFDINTINNREVKRLYSLIKRIKRDLITYDVIPATFKTFGYDIMLNIKDYVKKNGIYDYAYMRKFSNTLATDYSYIFGDPKIELQNINESEKELIINGFMTVIYNHVYTKKQIRIDDLTMESEEPISIYDENGEKIDEIPFHQETLEKTKNLNLRG